MTEKLAVGSLAPNFTAVNNNNQTVSLADYASGWLVLYFYPKDDTPGCTIEANDFTSYIPHFKQFGAQVIGVSPDSVESHCNFISKYNLGITLLSDSDHKVAESYGAWGLKNFMGKESMGIIRSTFLIDPTGKIAKAWYSVKANGHAEAVLNAFKSLI
jgi:thioredoxin-dependent peroxiredoxin